MTAPDIQITTEQCTAYKLRRTKTHRGFFWADAYVREWTGGGAISIQSDYGNFAYSWSATGPGRFIAFLCSLDFDYFMGKARSGYMRFDAEKTVKSLRRSIIERRRTATRRHDIRADYFTREQSRDCWDGINLHDLESCGDETEFFCRFSRDKDLESFVDGDYSGLALRSPDANAVAFWEECWPHLVQHWRAELAHTAQIARAA